MDLTQVADGDRLYVQDRADYGYVTRTSFLGLAKAPVVLLDDGTLRGYAGTEAEEQIVEPDLKKNSYGEDIDIPIDVRRVGIAQLTAHGTSTEVQALMFTNWRTKLTSEQRTTYMAAWAGVDAGNSEQLSGFLDQMVAFLTSL